MKQKKNKKLPVYEPAKNLFISNDGSEASIEKQSAEWMVLQFMRFCDTHRIYNWRVQTTHNMWSVENYQWTYTLQFSTKQFFRISRTGVMYESKTGLVMENKTDAVAFMFSKLSSLNPWKSNLLDTHILEYRNILYSSILSHISDINYLFIRSSCDGIISFEITPVINNRKFVMVLDSSIKTNERLKVYNYETIADGVVIPKLMINRELALLLDGKCMDEKLYMNRVGGRRKTGDVRMNTPQRNYSVDEKFQNVKSGLKYAEGILSATLTDGNVDGLRVVAGGKGFSFSWIANNERLFGGYGRNGLFISEGNPSKETEEFNKSIVYIKPNLTDTAFTGFFDVFNARVSATSVRNQVVTQLVKLNNLFEAIKNCFFMEVVVDKRTGLSCELRFPYGVKMKIQHDIADGFVVVTVMDKNQHVYSWTTGAEYFDQSLRDNFKAAREKVVDYNPYR